MRAPWRATRLALICTALLLGCGAASSEYKRDVVIGQATRRPGEPVDQLELQQDVQRVTTSFMQRIAHAVEPIFDQAQDAEKHETLLRRVLVYNSALLEIATGPDPEVNTIDMLVFTMLSGSVLEKFWIPNQLGKPGEALIGVFAQAEQDLWAVAAKILDPAKQADLRELIADWQRQHLEEHHVENIRLLEFSQQVASISDDRAQKTQGLIGEIRTAARGVDQALLAVERGFFLAHRMPFLVRLQARIGVQESISDSLGRVGDLKLDGVQALLGKVPEMKPMLTELTQLTTHAEAAARETRMLASSVEPYLERFADKLPDATGAGAAGAARHDAQGRPLAPSHAAGAASPGESGLMQVLGSANHLTEQSLALVRELRGAVPSDPASTASAIERRIDRIARRWVVYLLLVGLGWAICFWTGYFVVKRLTAPRERASAESGDNR